MLANDINTVINDDGGKRIGRLNTLAPVQSLASHLIVHYSLVQLLR